VNIVNGKKTVLTYIIKNRYSKAFIQ